MIDQKLSLEIRGERVSIYLRLFLIIIFSIGTAIGIYLKNEIYDIYGSFVIGIFLFGLTIPFSYFFLKTNSYNPKIKYYSHTMAYFSYSIVVFGYLRLDDIDKMVMAVNNIVMYAVFYLFIVESFFRFSPTLTLVSSATRLMLDRASIQPITPFSWSW